MSGLSDTKEAALLDSTFGQTLYLRLLEWDGANTNDGIGITANDDGTLPTNVTEVSTGGYTALAVASTDWADAVGGAPSFKQVPKSGGSALTFTPTGGATWDICGYCWTTDAAAISSANLVSSGVMIDSNGDPCVQHVTGAAPLSITDLQPIVERFGDTPAGVDPT